MGECTVVVMMVVGRGGQCWLVFVLLLIGVKKHHVFKQVHTSRTGALEDVSTGMGQSGHPLVYSVYVFSFS